MSSLHLPGLSLKAPLPCLPHSAFPTHHRLSFPPSRSSLPTSPHLFLGASHCVSASSCVSLTPPEASSLPAWSAGPNPGTGSPAYTLHRGEHHASPRSRFILHASLPDAGAHPTHQSRQSFSSPSVPSHLSHHPLPPTAITLSWHVPKTPNPLGTAYWTTGLFPLGTHRPARLLLLHVRSQPLPPGSVLLITRPRGRIPRKLWVPNPHPFSLSGRRPMVSRIPLPSLPGTRPLSHFC